MAPSYSVLVNQRVFSDLSMITACK